MVTPTRVLIVDDDAPFRRLLRLILAAPELEIVGEAADGAEALEATRRLAPDLVLMDNNMPVMSGLEAARLMAQLPTRPVIVMLTSDASPELCAAALRFGVGTVLPKGLSINALGHAVLAAASVAARPLERAA
ncbi:response regulator [Oscillochloris sp. ZM17-4]|uniref:response regulator transcription factor n=1 Tax=Oscillochloris sp. ZM17-4 TaxID=2866714 RepID=UPI001C7357A0|nr:response regulator [Oscillochloris sp. ZM17-4]MBX0327212.1 response regulator [Oscillochloris sp. ZM17-4]